LTSSDDDVKPVHPDGAILDRVYARGRSLRRRRLALRAGSGLLALAFIAAGGIGVSNLVGTTKPPEALNKPSSSPVPSSSGSFLAPPAAPAVLLPKTGGPPPVHASPTARVCVDSFDSACGRFYWSPTPGPNAPITATISASTLTLTVGQRVDVTGTASDPDAKFQCTYIDWGPTYIGTALTIRARFGRWVTPPKTRDHEAAHFSHVYEHPGTYKIVFYAVSGSSCVDPQANPYSSEGSASLSVTVVAAPTPSPSASVSPSPSQSS